MRINQDVEPPRASTVPSRASGAARNTSVAGAHAAHCLSLGLLVRALLALGVTRDKVAELTWLSERVSAA